MAAGHLVRARRGRWQGTVVERQPGDLVHAQRSADDRERARLLHDLRQYPLLLRLSDGALERFLPVPRWGASWTLNVRGRSVSVDHRAVRRNSRPPVRALPRPRDGLCAGRCRQVATPLFCTTRVASSAMVDASSTSQSGTSKPTAADTRDAICAARSESPPTIRKGS